MAAKQLPIDLKVLGVIANRHKWMLVILTFFSFALSAVIARSIVDVYSASIVIFVDPENVLGDIAKGVAVTSNLNDQLNTLRHLILSEDFIEPNVIQELDIRLSDIYIPPAHLTFTPMFLRAADSLKNVVKTLFGLEVYSLSSEQKQLLERLEVTSILKEQISITQSQGRLLTISYGGPNQTACKKIVEIVANQCRDLLLRTKNQETRDALRYIEGEYSQATNTLEDLERELANMRVEQFDKGPEAKIALLQQRQESLDTIRLLNQDMETLNSKKQEMEMAKAKRQTVLRQDPVILQKLAEQTRNQDAITLEESRKRLKELIERGFTNEWPEVKKLQTRIAELENSLKTQVQSDPEAEETIFLADPIYNEYYRQIKQIESDQNSMGIQAQKLQANVNIYEEKLKQMPEVEKGFASLERKIELHEALQIDLAKRRETARATMELEKTRGENRIRVLSRTNPNKPTGIPPIAIMIVVCMIGPSIGGGIIFLLYYLNNSVKSPEDVQIEYNLPVIAVIPKTNFKRESQKHLALQETVLKRAEKLREKLIAMMPVLPTLPPAISRFLPSRSSPTSDAAPFISPTDSFMELAPMLREEEAAPESLEIELAGRIMKRIPTPPSTNTSSRLIVTMFTNPKSQAAEEYRRLCFNVEWGLKETLSGPCRTILVTSALPNEGKTLTSINLALTLARTHRVLLVDSNFRKPSIHQAFGIEASPGLADFLEHQVTPQLYYPPESPNLTVFTSGIGGWHPADLLTSNPMTQFVESVKSSSFFEFAVFDVPPVSLIPDSSIIASKVDGIVWVIWELSTAKEAVRQALARVTNPAILGVVLNRSEQRALPKKYDKIWREYQHPSLKKGKP